ncbi:MAG: putative acetyltransferase [Candidatus Saccharibacteria bacterium]|jgi:predicted GNAT family N-acyltransferase|nr:putative acetyltransferase [Candidatus Saccharibacteria bacterium]
MPRPDELEAVRRLRHQVLDADHANPTELKLSEIDKHPDVIHMAAFAGRDVICTVRLQPLTKGSSNYLVRKMATRPDYQGQGIGVQVLAAAEQEAIRRGVMGFSLDSRVKATTFYAKSGYKETGEQVIRDGDLNITMTKQVNK